MANARLSPAASLLRNSRLFAIPAPLTPVTLGSDTATQPYPTHAAIETPPSSWVRGDWGFKRSLPLKSTAKTGTTTIRVQNGIDSIEHITDFESAADHVLTLRKWRELNLPVQFTKKQGRGDRSSVFETSVDNITTPKMSSHRRWRYKGPWLAGQAGWDFDALVKRVKSQKGEFREYVRERLSAEKKSSTRQEARDAGLDLNQVEMPKVTDEELDEYIRHLRATPTAFGPLIAEFLDLPEGPREDKSGKSTSLDTFTYGRTTLATEAYSETGPPTTHPSAGLSYYRSGAHVINHPVFGPQKDNLAVEARLLRPGFRRKIGDVGVAGFVVALTTNTSNATKSWQPQPGGVKMLVSPRKAVVDSDGRLHLHAQGASIPAEAVYTFDSDASAEEKKPREVPQMAENKIRSMPRLDEKSSREVKRSHDSLDDLMRPPESSV